MNLLQQLKHNRQKAVKYCGNATETMTTIRIQHSKKAVSYVISGRVLIAYSKQTTIISNMEPLKYSPKKTKKSVWN